VLSEEEFTEPEEVDFEGLIFEEFGELGILSGNS
jgi:hypothetical protein